MESKHQPKARDRTEHDAAIHVRVSTGQGTGKLAIGRREKKCRERAERDGVEVRLERVYCDLGASAAGLDQNRPAYDRLLAGQNSTRRGGRSPKITGAAPSK